MKKIIWIFTLSILLAGCNQEYEFSTEFTTPTALNSPDSVTIDVASQNNIVLSWTGGGAVVGDVIYQVLFDKVGGDFSNPVYTTLSDLGAEPQLTITHALLNTIARKAGLAPASTGNIIWTVSASKGGEVKLANLSKEISVTRGGGIDYTGDTLYLFGTATENNGAGLEMRKAADGIFIIYTKADVNGNIFFKSSKTDLDAFTCYADANGKIMEGTGTYDITANAEGEIYRITVDMNTQKIAIDKISDIRAIWGATYNVIGNLIYQGNGILKADNCEVKFIMTSRPETDPPSWLSWTEERYYFIANVNGTDKCWGRRDGVSAERPTGSETMAFYELEEFSWNQWEHLWKMSGSLDLKKCTITIDTNKSGLMVHEFSNIQPI